MSITAAFERALSFDRIAQRIARAVYRHDSRGADHYLRDIFVPPDTYAIVYEAMQEQYWRVDYTITENEDVVINERADWVQVENVWQPVTTERMTEMRAEKRDLLSESEASEAVPPAQTRAAASGDGAGGIQAPATAPASASARPALARMTRTAEAHHRASSDGNRSTFLIMTEALARDGISVNPDGVDTTAYMRNPVVLWQHGEDPRRGAQPIGRCAGLVRRRSGSPEENGLVATVEWYDDAFSQSIRDQVKSGFISAVSFSWLPLERTVVEMGSRRVPRDERSEMLEFSVVGVGGDGEALVMQRTPASDGRNEDRFLQQVRAAVREEIRSMDSTVAASADTGSATAPSNERATAPVAPDGSGDDATASSPAPAVPAMPRVNLNTARSARQQRLRRALLEANKRLGRA